MLLYETDISPSNKNSKTGALSLPNPALTASSGKVHCNLVDLSVHRSFFKFEANNALAVK